VQVKTWVVDFRRVRSRRDYELRLAGSGELVAQARTDWAFLDSATGRPVPIPEEMIAAFLTAGAHGQTQPRDRFPVPPSVPPGAFHTLRRVEWRDLDTAGHVNNAVHLAYVEDCAVQAASACGWPPQRLEAEGLAIQARDYRIEYQMPALFGAELEITTWLSEVERAAAVGHFELRRVTDSALVSRARTLWGTTSFTSGEPVPFPDAFLADLAPMIA
jgi:acyl-CoA thioester hydrolase